MKIIFCGDCGHRRIDTSDAFVFPIAATLRYAGKKLNGYFERFGKQAFEKLCGVPNAPIPCFVPVCMGQSILIPVAHPEACGGLLPDACEFWLNIMELLSKMSFSCAEVHPSLWLAGMKLGAELEGMAQAADAFSSSPARGACVILPPAEKIILNAGIVAKIMKMSKVPGGDIAEAIKSLMGPSRQNLYLHALGHSELQN